MQKTMSFDRSRIASKILPVTKNNCDRVFNKYCGVWAAKEKLEAEKSESK